MTCPTCPNILQYRKEAVMAKISPKARPRKSGGWEAVHYYDMDELTGKRKKITTYGKTKTEAEGKMEQKLAQILNGTHVDPNDMDMKGWCTYWLDTYAQPKVKHSTYTNYRMHIEKRIIPKMGHIKLNKLNTDILQRFLNEEFLHGNRRYPDQPLSAKTIHNLYLLLHTMLEQAYKNGMIIKNYAEFISLPKIQAVEMRVLSLDEQTRLYRVIQTSTERYKIGSHLPDDRDSCGR